MSPAEDLLQKIDKRAEYVKRVAQAYQFAGDVDAQPPDVWDGLFMMGLAMSNLDLLSLDSMVDMQWYWNRAPVSKSIPPTWEASWIIERDAFHGHG